MRSASGSSPVSRGACRSASTIEPRFGCEVSPLIESIAASTASQPASIASRMLAAAMPLVSCVWKWIGRPTSSLSAFTSAYAARGWQQTRHVLDAEHVRAGLLELLRHLHVVREGVLRLARVGDVARVADRGLARRLPVVARPRRSRRACSRPSSASRRCGTRRCPPARPGARSSARRCRDSSCTRPRSRSAAASAAAGSASPRGAARGAPTGIPSGTASRRRTSRRPSIRREKSCGSRLA